MRNLGSCAAILLALIPSLARADSGRDAYYVWSNVDETGGPTYGNFNPGDHGATPMDLSTGDSLTVTLPFTFPFFGTDWDEVTIHTYGVISMGDGSHTPGAWASGQCIADDSTDGIFVAPYWYNWDIDTYGDMYYLEYPAAIYVFWDNMRTGSSDTADTAFGVWLFASGEVEFAYERTASGLGTTAYGKAGAQGIQGGATLGKAIGCQTYSLNNFYDMWSFAPLGFRDLAGEFTTDSWFVTTYEGEAASDRFGFATANAADVTSDGIDDLIVGAPYNDSAAASAGAAYVYAGSTSLGDDSVPVTSAWATILGTSGIQVGSAVAGNGDFDGDGHADILVGAPYADTGASDSGSVGMFLSPSAGSTTLSAADATYYGAAASDGAGWSIDFAGDVDGDGYDDLLIGAPFSNSGGADSGAAYLIWGRASTSGGSLSSADVTLVGDVAGDQAGYRVRRAGDIDGDDLDDLLVGAFANDGGGTSSGAIYVVRGDDVSDGSHDLSTFDVIYGASASDGAGMGLTPAGDVDADGLDDLYFGAYIAGTVTNGAAYFVYGSEDDFPSDLGDAETSFTGDASDRLGFSTTSLAVNRGDHSLAAGAYGANDAATGAGAIFMFHENQALAGGTFTVDDAWGTMLPTSTDDSAKLGWAVATADLNDDGNDDLIGGAYEGDGAAAASGTVWVALGTTTFPDADGDGFVSDYYGGPDCDDSDDDVGPAGTDICDGIDNDCDGTADNGYTDTDGDGTADCVEVEECDGVDNDGDGLVDEGFPDTDGDGICDGIDGEVCDGADNDGDGLVDEGFPDTDGDGIVDCLDSETCDGVDNDGDGSVDEGFPDTDRDRIADCMDHESCDGLDNDGDGTVDEGFTDTDHDGTADCIDRETCDGVDNDGDRVVDEGMPDSDGDGICDGLDTEECDGVDNDGDGHIDEGMPDTDGDGIADCLDTETCDGIDNDGDGLVDEDFADSDSDGIADCVEKEVCDGADNDGDGLVDEGFPDNDNNGIPDCLDSELCDGLDNNGDGNIDEGYPDADDDGTADCIDVETCDGIDNDGDGDVDEGFQDDDGDGTADCVEVPDDSQNDTGGTSNEGGCGNCNSGGGSPLGAFGLLLVLPAIVRRRRLEVESK
jgi:uncharacterized protein (TIGR03382 family)